jgi:hypothetical protein
MMTRFCKALVIPVALTAFGIQTSFLHAAAFPTAEISLGINTWTQAASSSVFFDSGVKQSKINSADR